MLAIAAPGSGAAPSVAAPAWDVTGVWTAHPGDLDVRQAADGSLTGTFRMKEGCLDSYRVGREGRRQRRLDRSDPRGRRIRLRELRRTQTLNGTVGASGAALHLALVNAHQASPATPPSPARRPRCSGTA